MPRIFAKEEIKMNIARCMLRKCEQCRYEQICFRKDVEKNEYTKNKNHKAKASGIQPKKRPMLNVLL